MQKISDLKNENITTADLVANEIKSEGSLNQSDIAGLIDNTYLDKE